MKADEIGAVHVYTRGSDTSFSIHPDLYQQLKVAWMAGKAFFECTDVYGDEIVLKLGAVEAIHLGTPEHIAEFLADKKRAEQAQALE